jgi:hypothetical protein
MQFDRRTIIGSALGLVLPGTASLAASASTPLKFNDVYQAGMEFSPLTTNLNGQTVEMRGYMAPPLKAQSTFFVLTRLPMSFCPFCDKAADWPEDIVLVFTPDVIDVVPYNFLIAVSGRLDIGTSTDAETGFVSRLRLLDAAYRRL